MLGYRLMMEDNTLIKLCLADVTLSEVDKTVKSFWNVGLAT